MKKRRVSKAAALMVAAITVPAAVVFTEIAFRWPIAGSPQPVGSVPGPWDLVLNSKFDGSSLSPSVWSTGAWGAPGVTVGNDNIEQDCYDPSRVSVAGGSLSITAIAQEETCGSVHQPYATGSVTTYGHFSFTYGYMEARIWLPGSGNVSDWPAFWAVGEPYSDAKGEIDVVEGLHGRACATFHDVTGAGTPACASGSFTGGWHTFAANWEPGSINFYYDGTEISTVTSGVTASPMFLVIDLAVSTSMSPPDIAPTTLRVAYVRVWQH
jgi:beta-glucanase (GH16 family)